MKKHHCSKNTIETILIVLFCLFLLWLSVFQITSWLKTDMFRGLSALEENMMAVSDTNDKYYNNYELIQKHITRMGAWYLRKREDPYSVDSVNRAKDLLEANAVFIIDPDGNLISGSDQISSDKFVSDFFQALRIVSPDQPISDLVQDLSDEKAPSGAADEGGDIQEGQGFLPEEIDKEEDPVKDSEDTDSAAPYDVLSYYSYYMDPGHILVVCNSYADSVQSNSVTRGSYDLVGKTKYGNNGFYISVTEEGDVLITSDEDADVNSPEELRLPAKKLSDGYSGLLSFKGKTYYSCMKKMKIEGNYLICLLPLAELMFSIFIVGFTTVAVVFISLLIMKYYAEMMTLEPAKGRKRGELIKSFRYRLLVLTIACVCATVAVNIYLRTLYNYSNTISQITKKSQNLVQEVAGMDKIQEDGSENYRKAVRIFTRTGGAVVLEHPDHTDSISLKELADVVGADHVLVYDKTGKVTKSDLNFTGLTLSNNPEDMSHEFWWIIRGYPLLIQEQADSHYLPDPYYYSGVTLTDGKGNYYGMVQLAIPPSLRENMVASTSLDTIMSTYEAGDSSFSFIIDKDKNIVYTPYFTDENKQIAELGFTEDKIFEENYTGFFKKNDYKVLGCSRSMDNYQVIVGSFTDLIPLYGVRSGFSYAVPGLLAEILYFFILLARISHPEILKPEEKRFFFRNRKKEEAKAEAKLLAFLKYACIGYAALITVIVFAGSALFKEGSPGYYIFVYPWIGSFNIFTVTRCINYFCIVALAIYLLIKLLMLLATLLPSRQETVVRLILSFVRYAAVIGALFFCMTILGVPTASLLLSAGALTAIFSFGAQNTVADILAGLFIIFEGSFKVGDMITVDDWHGQVEEIGIRNTTIRDLAADDVKIMNNSTIKKVINCSTYLSRCSILIGIEYGMDLREIEAIVEKEKETIEKNLEGKAKNFTYLGVEEFADSAVILKFRVNCKNQDYIEVQRALRREVKLMFDHNNIQVPFPQLVLHN